MKKRKTPYRHPVRSHMRDGIKVSKYMRGEGPKPYQTIRKRYPTRGSDFTIIVYFDGETETHPVRAKTYTDALNAGINVIQTPEIPSRIRIRRG